MLILKLRNSFSCTASCTTLRENSLAPLPYLPQTHSLVDNDLVSRFLYGFKCDGDNINKSVLEATIK